MTDYKSTLNLPQTSFPMRANLPTREPKILAKWEELDIYQYLRQARVGKQKWVLHDGPPYANGEIHLGHAVNKVLKDMINKSRLLMGYDVPYVPGWDCHGLPIEVGIEKKYGRPGQKLSAREFRAACRDYASGQIIKQKQGFQRLGVVGDWQNPYLTMSPQIEADTIRALGRIIAKGHLQRGYKPVHWCFDCCSALAEAEIEYQDKRSLALDVAFAFTDPQACLQRLGLSAQNSGSGKLATVIWTTTPWTLPANQMVNLHPESSYCLVEAESNSGQRWRLLLSEQLHEQCLERYQLKPLGVLARARGQDLAGLELTHPFYERSVPIGVGAYVSESEGSGAVHSAPAYGLDDFQSGQELGLEILNPVDDRGRFAPDFPAVGGWHIWRDEAQLIELLKNSGNLLAGVEIRHSYPHCWRHKKPTIYRATSQWFISMEAQNLRASALEGIAATNWVPDWGEARIRGMIEKRPDWCISRQRYWGVPITLWTHKTSNKLHPKTLELLEQVAQLVEQQSIDAWFELDDSQLLGADSQLYERSSNTLDVWFDSGTTHHSVLRARPELQFPAQLYLEGSDQHRGWFHSSLLASCAINGCPPYEQVLTHGFTVDENGHKMSKSLGNVIAPQEIIGKLGADVLRLWIAASDYRGEIPISKEVLARISDTYRRIRNTMRYLLANTADFNPSLSPAAEHWLQLDCWLLRQTLEVQEQVTLHYERYEFSELVSKIHNYCSFTLGAVYLDVSKDRQYTLGRDSSARRSAQHAMYQALEALVRWIAPVLSFTAEEVWELMPERQHQSALAASFSESQERLQSACARAPERLSADDWQQLLQLRELVNRELEQARNDKVIGSSLEAEVKVQAPAAAMAAASKLGDELKFWLLVSRCELEEQASGTYSIEVAASAQPKCIRCWHRVEDVGQHPEHPELCGRCVVNLTTGEARRYF